MGYVYLVRAEQLRLVKIGLSRNIFRRLHEMQVGSPDRLILQTLFTTEDPAWLEQMLHQRFRHLRVRGEWFRPDADMEDWLSTYLDTGTPGARFRYSFDMLTPERLADVEQSPTAVIRRPGEKLSRFTKRVLTMAARVHGPGVFV